MFGVKRLAKESVRGHFLRWSNITLSLVVLTLNSENSPDVLSSITVTVRANASSLCWDPFTLLSFGMKFRTKNWSRTQTNSHCPSGVGSSRPGECSQMVVEDTNQPAASHLLRFFRLGPFGLGSSADRASCRECRLDGRIARCRWEHTTFRCCTHDRNLPSCSL